MDHILSNARARVFFAWVLLLLPAAGLAGCEVVGDIFKAGVWVGVLLVLGVIGLVVWLLTRAA